MNAALQGTVFPNYCNSTGYSVGANATMFFEGFIYEFSVYTYVVAPLRLLQNSQCEAPYNGVCLPVCVITQYWVGPEIGNCEKCTYGCRSCRRNDTCNLCSDVLCEKCNNFTYCNQCVDNTVYEQSCSCNNETIVNYLNYSCIQCGVGQYYDKVTCVDCPVLCATCEIEKCLSCIDNAVLDDNACTCKVGYNGTQCDPAFFTASLQINKDNSIYIIFSDDLITDLTARSLQLTSNSTSDPIFTILQTNAHTYYLTLFFMSTIPEYCELKLLFLTPNEIVSVCNSILRTDALTTILYSSDSMDSTISISNKQESVGTTTTITMTTITIATIVINPNPSCLWSFISTIQMLCFIAMTNIDLPPKFKGYLRGLRKYNLFPNIFTYFIPHYGGERPFDKAYEFGYTDDLIYFNSGSYISAFLSMIAVWVVTYILSKLTHIRPLSIGFVKEKIENTLKNYKYAAFIRFWITCYIDVFAASLIVFCTTTNFLWPAILNYAFAITITVILT